MNSFSKITIISIICIPLCLNTLLAKDNNRSNKCQEAYLSCAHHQLDESWSLREDYNAGLLKLTQDEFDSKHLNIMFNLYACDAVTSACEANRKPDFKEYLETKQAFPEAEWPKSDPDTEGLDEHKLQQSISSAASIPGFRSLLVATNGKLVVEEYFSRKDDLRPQHIQSITKSITSLLIGIAIDKGLIKSEQEAIKPYFPEYFSKPHDKRKQDITIEQLLTMTSRLNFADSPSYSAYKGTKNWYEPGSWKAYWYADNFYDRALHYDLVETEDDVAIIYNTPSSNLLTTILSRSVNMTAKEFADKYLFGPLGIKNYYWFRDSNYNYVGGHTLYLRPRDLARVGQMIIDEGSYLGRQIVSKAWLQKSFNSTVAEFVKTDDGEQVFDYGYLWYTGEHQNYQYQFAWGHGGQFLFLIPDAKTIVVITAYPDTNGITHWEHSQKIIKNILLNVVEALPSKIQNK